LMMMMDFGKGQATVTDRPKYLKKFPHLQKN